MPVRCNCSCFGRVGLAVDIDFAAGAVVDDTDFADPGVVVLGVDTDSVGVGFGRVLVGEREFVDLQLPPRQRFSCATQLVCY